MNILDTVKNILKQRNIDPSSINENDALSSLGLDSLDLVEVSIEIEDAFSIEFTSEEIGSLTTVKSMLDLISSKIK